MVQLQYASLAQIASELRLRACEEKARREFFAKALNVTLRCDLPKGLAAIAEELQKLADAEWKGSEADLTNFAKEGEE